MAILLPAARKRWTWRHLITGLAYAATLVLFVVANKLTTSANAIFLQSTAPGYLILLSPLLLKEHLRRSDIWLLLGVGTGMALFFIAAEPDVRALLTLLPAISWVHSPVLRGRLRSWVSLDGTGR